MNDNIYVNNKSAEGNNGKFHFNKVSADLNFVVKNQENQNRSEELSKGVSSNSKSANVNDSAVPNNQNSKRRMNTSAFLKKHKYGIGAIVAEVAVISLLLFYAYHEGNKKQKSEKDLAQPSTIVKNTQKPAEKKIVESAKTVQKKVEAPVAIQLEKKPVKTVVPAKILPHSEPVASINQEVNFTKDSNVKDGNYMQVTEHEIITDVKLLNFPDLRIKRLPLDYQRNIRAASEIFDLANQSFDCEFSSKEQKAYNLVIHQRIQSLRKEDARLATFMKKAVLEGRLMYLKDHCFRYNILQQKENLIDVYNKETGYRMIRLHKKFQFRSNER